jgi:hypothetical protein
LGHHRLTASRIETRELNGVDPLSYLADVLTRIADGDTERWITTVSLVR